MSEIIQTTTSNSELIKENQSLRRQLRNVESQLQRNQAMLAARNNVNATLLSEQHKTEQGMNLLLENSPDIILLFDSMGRFTHCTNAFLTATNTANFGLLNGRHFTSVFSRFVSTEWTDHLNDNFKKAMIQKKTVVLNDDIDFSGNEQIHSYEIHITPMMAENGSVEGSLMLFHDLTDVLQAKKVAEKANNAKSEFVRKSTNSGIRRCYSKNKTIYGR